MALGWINYLSVVVGSANFIMLIIITTIVMKRTLKEKINWLFAMSFFFLALAYVFLPLGAFVYSPDSPTAMVLLTKIYGLCLFIGLILLMLSSLAFNYGTHFTMHLAIIIPSIVVTLVIAGLFFGLTNTESNLWYSIKGVGGENADIQTSLFFSLIFYPISLIVIFFIIFYFIRAYKYTRDANVKQCLRFFIAGFSLSISSLIPNILSNILADYWENAQILNAVEFIIVILGMFLMLLGFFVKSLEAIEEPAVLETVEVLSF